MPHWSRVLIAVAFLAGCSSGAPPEGVGGGGGAAQNGGASGDAAAPTSADGSSAENGGRGGRSAEGGSGGVVTGGSGGAAAGPDAASSGPGDSGTADLGSGGRAEVGSAGTFDCTMNAGDKDHHVGSEHKGHTMYGVVVDTTAGANRALVGAVQSQVVMADLFVKFVWPKILIAGHTYEIAVFDDMSSSKMCTAKDRTWLWQVPMVTGDFVADWMTGHQPYTTGSCKDFPAQLP